jgi:hypothetical protein
LPKAKDDLRTQAKAADCLGITPQAIGMWGTRPGAPVVLVKGKRSYRWPDFPRWREAELARQLRETAAPKTQTDADLRLTVAKAQKAEMEVALLEKHQVNVEDAVAEITPMLDALRAVLLAFTPKHAHRFVGLKTIAEVTSELEPAIHEVMGTLSSENLA